MKKEELVKNILDNIDNIFNEDNYARFLNNIGRFRNYSINNQILILLQMPEAFKLAGYRTWQDKYNRHVKAGEHGIDILAPSEYSIFTDKNGERVDVSRMNKKDINKMVRTGAFTVSKHKGYRGVKVFDISQTEVIEGLEDKAAGITGLTGDYKGFEHIKHVVESLTQANVEITDELYSTETFGHFNIEKNKICVKKSVSDVQKTATLLHEAGHALVRRLMTNGKIYNGDYNNILAGKVDTIKLSLDDEEVLVESSAYAVMNYLGIDSSEFSFGYIYNWSTAYRSTEDGKKILVRLLEYTGKLASIIIDGIENSGEEKPFKEVVFDFCSMEANAVQHMIKDAQIQR